jgi:hypothetical protein
VLVVGRRRSGCQIAEQLHEAGREVFLACGRAGWAPRRIRGYDIFWWLLETGELDAPVMDLIRKLAAERGLPEPEIPAQPFDGDALEWSIPAEPSNEESDVERARSSTAARSTDVG